MIRQVRFDPLHGLMERWDGGLTKLFQGNLGIDDPCRDGHILLFCDHEYCSNLRRRVFRIIGITDEQTLSDHVHCEVRERLINSRLR